MIGNLVLEMIRQALGGSSKRPPISERPFTPAPLPKGYNKPLTFNPKGLPKVPVIPTPRGTIEPYVPPASDAKKRDPTKGMLR